MDDELTGGNSIRSRRSFLRALGGGIAAMGVQVSGVNPPNLLFMIIDQVRYDCVSLFGNKILKTPNIDRIGKEGVAFTNAVTPCPLCAPARAAMLGGYTTRATGVPNNTGVHRKDNFKMPTYDNILAESGYWTEYFGKWHAPIHKARSYKGKVLVAGVSESEFGMGLNVAYQDYLESRVPKPRAKMGQQIDYGRSKRPYVPLPLDYRYGMKPTRTIKNKRGKEIKVKQPDCYGKLLIPPEHTVTAFIANDTIKALGRVRQPFSLHCSIGPPHAPLTLPDPYFSRYPARYLPAPTSIDDDMEHSPYREQAIGYERYRDKDKIRGMIQCYYGMVSEVDEYVGKILDVLRDRKIEKNTLVIFTSDHGEMMGSHGMREKNNFYEESVHVPLLIRFPGTIHSGAVVDAPVSLMDLFPTILDYLGQKPRTCHGTSLRPIIEGRSSGEDFAVSEWDQKDRPNFMVRTRDWKYMTGRNPESEVPDGLYHLTEDPHEMINLISGPRRTAKTIKKAREMKERLISWMKKVDYPFQEDVKARKI